MNLKRFVSNLLIIIVLIITIDSGSVFAETNQTLARYMVYYEMETEQANAAKARQSFDGEIIINDNTSVVIDTQSNIALRYSDRSLKYIEVDSVVSCAETQNFPAIAAQLRQVLANFATPNGTAVKIALLDSGVNVTTDLPLAGGTSFVSGSAYDNDENGHGTSLAKLIKGYTDDNGIKFSGLAPDADLYSVKILDSAGNGYYSNVVRALDWVHDNQIDLVIIAFDAADYSAILSNSFAKINLQNIAVCSLGDYSAILQQPPAEAYAIPKVDTIRLTEEQQEANSRYIYNKLLAEGWTKQAIAALLGNIQQESQMNPAVWQVQNNTSRGYGLVQWDDGADFLNWQGGTVKNCALTVEAVNQLAIDDPARLIDMQLEFLIWSSQAETENLNKRWLPTLRYDSPRQMTYEAYVNSTADVAELTLVFHASYERSVDGVARLNSRIAYAKRWYQFLMAQ